MSINQGKRRALKKLTVASGVTATGLVVWRKPIINSVLLPAHAQTSSVANQAPLGESFTVDAFADGSIVIELAARISDPDGDALTVSIVDSGVLGGALTLDNASLIGPTTVSVSVSNGSGEIYVDYQVSDGMASSPVYRITVTNLDGPFTS